jgi:hypothetical protein
MENIAVRYVTPAVLRLSRDPSSDLAAAAIRAQEASGLEAGEAAFLVIAVPAGDAGPAAVEARSALEALNVTPASGRPVR